MVDYKHKDLFLRDSFHQDISIKSTDGEINITNTELHFEQFELFESLCSEPALKFGRCESSVLKFRISNVVGSLIGKELVVSSHINGADDYFTYGTYKVASDKPTADKKSRDVVAYDKMYDIINSDVAEWYNSLQFPLSLKDFRDSFFAYFGLTQDDVALSNDAMNVEKTISPSELSGEVVVNAICEINGCFGHIGRDGKFRYIFLKEMVEGLYPSQTLFPRDDLFPADAINAHDVKKSHYITADYEEFTVQRINKLQIRKEENDVGVTYGTGSNLYVVEDNFLLYGKSTEELHGIAYNMYSVIKNVWYRPARVDAKGNPCLEVGDGIKLHTSYAVVYTYILQRTLKGIQALRDSYVADGEEKQPTNANSYHKEIIQLKGKTNVLSRTVEETRLEMTDIEKDLSAKITANASEISSKVSKGNVISEINQTAESVTIKAEKIDLVGLVQAKEFISSYASVDSLNALDAKVSRIDADYASVGQLDAVSAKVDTINADYVTTSQLNAVNAKFYDLNADNITVGTLNIDRIDLAGLSSKTIEVQTLIASKRITSAYINTDTFNCGQLNGKNPTWTQITINGTTYTVLTA